MYISRFGTLRVMTNAGIESGYSSTSYFYYALEPAVPDPLVSMGLVELGAPGLLGWGRHLAPERQHEQPLSAAAKTTDLALATLRSVPRRITYKREDNTLPRSSTFIHSSARTPQSTPPPGAREGSASPPNSKTPRTELNEEQYHEQFLLTLIHQWKLFSCLLYTSPSPRDRQKSRMPSSA